MAKKVWYGSAIGSFKDIVHILEDFRPYIMEDPQKKYSCGMKAIWNDTFTREVPERYRICGNCLRAK